MVVTRDYEGDVWIMEVIYEHPFLTIVFIAAIGFWYAVGKSCE